VTALPSTGHARPAAVLIGSMGAGKSSVGHALARKLGVAFRDTDEDIEARTGTTIADLFVSRGEPHFRALEVEAVRDALAEHAGVLALGGGAPMQPAIANLLAGHRVVFLDVGLAEAVRRVGLGTSRPLLLGNVRGQLRTRLEERRPVYEALALLTMRVDTATVDELATAIADELARTGVSP
jgi:shikimate kinase